MLEASAGSLDELLSGTYLFLGDFGMCVNFQHEQSGSTIQGKYALLQFRPEAAFLSQANSSLEWKLQKTFSDEHSALVVGMCLPSSCTQTDIEMVFSSS